MSCGNCSSSIHFEFKSFWDRCLSSLYILRKYLVVEIQYNQPTCTWIQSVYNIVNLQSTLIYVCMWVCVNVLLCWNCFNQRRLLPNAILNAKYEDRVTFFLSNHLHYIYLTPGHVWGKDDKESKESSRKITLYVLMFKSLFSIMNTYFTYSE